MEKARESDIESKRERKRESKKKQRGGEQESARVIEQGRE